MVISRWCFKIDDIDYQWDSDSPGCAQLISFERSWVRPKLGTPRVIDGCLLYISFIYRVSPPLAIHPMYKLHWKLPSEPTRDKQVYRVKQLKHKLTTVRDYSGELDDFDSENP